MYRDNGFYLETGLVLPVCIQLPRAMGAVFSTDCENLLDSGTVPMPIGMQGGLRLTVGAHSRRLSRRPEYWDDIPKNIEVVMRRF